VPAPAGISRWNYIFSFRTGPDSHVTCQYQLGFERESGRYLVDSIHWNGPECLDALNQPPPTPPAVRTLSADALFPFDRSGVEDILPQGRAEVAALVKDLMKEGEPSRITVVGHADRLGGAAYNQALSEQRAITVRQLMVEDGIPADSITAFGRGSTEPVTICDRGLPHARMVECLAPDRRVEIRVDAGR
jgi:outer membrane protein OmpA-like peptidoglycan-associated protein